MSEVKTVTITNGLVTAVISAQAAEVISFKRNDRQLETVWNRDPAFWYNTNPVLFPYTGALKDGQYTYQGVTYTLGQHGFARRALFSFEEVKGDACTLSLCESEATLAVYPFRFRLLVHYRLEGYKLNLDYQIINCDEKELPFRLGFHPTFLAPMNEGRSYQDCRIEFEKAEDLHHDQLAIADGKGFELAGVLEHTSFFYNNCQLKSDWVELTDGVSVVRVGFKGFATLGFWKKCEDAPFICIEPWHPVNSLKKAHTFNPDRENDLLPAGECFSCGYSWELIK